MSFYKTHKITQEDTSPLDLYKYQMNKGFCKLIDLTKVECLPIWYKDRQMNHDWGMDTRIEKVKHYTLECSLSCLNELDRKSVV